MYKFQSATEIMVCKRKQWTYLCQLKERILCSAFFMIEAGFTYLNKRFIVIVGLSKDL
jgi:hypothetical protein